MTAGLMGCATDGEQDETLVVPEPTREAAASEEVREPHEIDHDRFMDENIERLNSEIANGTPDPVWQAEVRERFHSRWKALNPDRPEPNFTQDFTCSVDLCAARVELSDTFDNRRTSAILSQHKLAPEDQLWGRAASRPEHGDDLQVWLYVWRLDTTTIPH